MKSMILLAGAAVLGLAGLARATPTVTLTLVIGQNNGGAMGIPGQWTLYADDSEGDNYGIVAIGVSICARIGVPTNRTDLSIVNDLPRISYLDSSGTASPDPLFAGFSLQRAAQAGLYIGSTGPIPFTGSMDTFAFGGLFVVQGFGQRAGTFPAPAAVTDAVRDPYDGTGVATQTTWAAHLKIAHGTYNTTTIPNGPVIDSDVKMTKANVLMTNVNGIQTFPPSTTVAANIVVPVLELPYPAEPGSLLLLGLGGLLLVRRRRARLMIPSRH